LCLKNWLLLNLAKHQDQIVGQLKFFKKCEGHLWPPPSLSIYNFYKETVILPQDWKTGHITPIHKKGNKTKINNHYLVCLTSIVIKVFESIIRDTMSKYLYDNNLYILSPNQHGFVPRRSCCTQLLHVFNDWTLSLDGYLSIDVVYLIFQKPLTVFPIPDFCQSLKHMESPGLV